MPDSPEEIVIDASVIVDLLAETSMAEAAHAALDDRRLFAPAHIVAEVLSALGRLQRAGLLTAPRAMKAVRLCAAMPVDRTPCPACSPERGTGGRAFDGAMLSMWSLPRAPTGDSSPVTSSWAASTPARRC